jgi:hypothetical protein
MFKKQTEFHDVTNVKIIGALSASLNAFTLYLYKADLIQ